MINLCKCNVEAYTALPSQYDTSSLCRQFEQVFMATDHLLLL